VRFETTLAVVQRSGFSLWIPTYTFKIWSYLLSTMRTSTLLPFAALVRHAVSQQFGADPRSAQDCVMWADIEDASVDTCEKTLRYWSAEPKRFHAWNPSVGLDCKPWTSQTSYCVLTQETVDNNVNYTTSVLKDAYITESIPLPSYTTDSDGWQIPLTRSDPVTRAYTTIPPVPSPSTWKEIGCYIDLWDDDNYVENVTWNMPYRYRPADSAETVDKCKQKCWDIEYKMAGLKLGNECWCGDRTNATLAEDQSECDLACAGDAKAKCGGTQRMNVWAAEALTGGALTAASGVGGSATGMNAAGATATASSGARQNRAFFGLL
jgi:hypothetical protein